jgi:hypothetical protein
MLLLLLELLTEELRGLGLILLAKLKLGLGYEGLGYGILLN